MYHYIVLLWQERSIHSLQAVVPCVDARSSSGWLWTARCSWVLHCCPWRTPSSVRRADTNCSQSQPVQLFHWPDIRREITIWCNVSFLWVSELLTWSFILIITLMYYSNVSTTIDPFRDISLDLAPRGKPGVYSYCVWMYMYMHEHATALKST